MTSLNVRLSCRHHTTIQHTTHADSAYCRFHGYQDIAYIWFQEWRVKCLTCTYGAWCKDSETGANRRAVKHTRDRGESHQCVVIYDDKIKPTTTDELKKLRNPPPSYTVDLFGYSTEPDAPPPF